MGRFDETDNTITRKIYSPVYDIQPRDGDVYLRYNPSKKAMYCFIFNGESEKFYDEAFGAGSETHRGKKMLYTHLIDLISKSNISDVFIRKINKKLKDVENI